MVGKSIQIALRVEPETIALADRIAERIGKAGGLGIEPTRTAIMRTALLRGLAEMDAEQAKPPRKR